jgi:uncharacterized protein YacL
LGRLSLQTLVSGLIGLVAGLIIAALLAYPISLLPSPFGDVLPFIGAILFAYLGVAVFVARQNDILSILHLRIPERQEEQAAENPNGSRTILLDTGDIDGRISDTARQLLEWHGAITFRAKRAAVYRRFDSLRRQRGRRAWRC